MAVTQHPITNMSLRDSIGALQAAVQAGEDQALTHHAARARRLADSISSSRDVRAIAVQRDRLDRIARAMRDLPDDPPLATFALGYLADTDRRLDRARTVTLGA